MDLALVLYDDIEALGVEYFFELTRSVCDLSPSRFDQLYNEFRSRATLSAAEFSDLLTTYLSEQNMMDLMNRAAEIHNKALRGSSLSAEWIDIIESIFDELDFGMTYLLTWNEVAILGVALARGQIGTWVVAKQNAMQLLQFCGRTGECGASRDSTAVLVPGLTAPFRTVSATIEARSEERHEDAGCIRCVAARGGAINQECERAMESGSIRLLTTSSELSS